MHRPTNAERDRGRQVLAEVSEVFVRRGFFLAELPVVEVCVAREKAQIGDLDGVIPVMRAAVDDQFREDGCWGGAFRRRVLWWQRCSTGGRK